MADYSCDKLANADRGVRAGQKIYCRPFVRSADQCCSGFVFDLSGATKREPNRRKQEHVKAIRVKEFGGPEILQLEEVPMLQPGLGQVLVRMDAIGINPVETYIRAGTYARLPE